MLQRGGACSPLLHNVIVFAGYKPSVTGDATATEEWNGMEWNNGIWLEQKRHLITWHLLIYAKWKWK